MRGEKNRKINLTRRTYFERNKNDRIIFLFDVYVTAAVIFAFIRPKGGYDDEQFALIA